MAKNILEIKKWTKFQALVFKNNFLGTNLEYTYLTNRITKDNMILIHLLQCLDWKL